MKDLLLLLKERKDYLLVFLFTTVTITLCGTFHILSSYGNHALLEQTPTAQEILLTLEQTPEIFTRGIAGGELLQCFRENHAVFCHNTAFLMVIAVLVLLFYGFQQKQTREFLETLPVKRSALELYGYVAAAALLILNFFVGGVTGLLTLTRRNYAIASLAKEFPELLESIIPENLVFQGNLAFLSQLLLAFLSLFAAMTFLYLCSCLFKNRYFGILVGTLIYISLPSFWYSFCNLFLAENRELKKTILTLFRQSPAFMILLLFLLIGGILLQIQTREMAKGIFMFSRPLEILFLLGAGAYCLVILTDLFDVFIGLGTVITFELLAFYFLYHKKKESGMLVAPKKIGSKLPLLKSALASHLIAGGILSAIVIYTSISLTNTVVREFFSFWNLFYTAADNPFLDFLGTPYLLYPDFNIILVGLFIFKGIKFLAEQKKSTREFLETLPATRGQVYFSKILLDLVVVLIALFAYMLVNFGYRIYFNNIVGNPLLYRFDDIIPAVMPTLYSAFFVIGICNLIDAFVVSGGLKAIHSIVTVVFLSFIVLLPLDFLPREYYWMAEDFLYSGLPFGIVSFFLGLLFILIACLVYCKRDTSKQGFYYAFGKHMFALQLTFIYATFTVFTLITSPDAKVTSLFPGVAGCILIYGITLYFCSPGWAARAMKKRGKSL